MSEFKVGDIVKTRDNTGTVTYNNDTGKHESYYPVTPANFTADGKDNQCQILEIGGQFLTRQYDVNHTEFISNISPIDSQVINNCILFDIVKKQKFYAHTSRLKKVDSLQVGSYAIINDLSWSAYFDNITQTYKKVYEYDIHIAKTMIQILSFGKDLPTKKPNNNNRYYLCFGDDIPNNDTIVTTPEGLVFFTQKRFLQPQNYNA